MSRYFTTVTIDLKMLIEKMMMEGRRFIKVEELARELCISRIAAGRILMKLSRLGYARRWSNGTYQLIYDDQGLFFNKTRYKIYSFHNYVCRREPHHPNSN